MIARHPRGSGGGRIIVSGGGEWTEEVFRVSLARVGERELPQARRAMIVQREYKESHPRGAGNGQFREPGRSDTTNERKQKAFVPPPAGRAGRVPREDFEGSLHSPRRFCVKGTGRVPPPRNASPAFGRLRRPPAALRAAPRAGASPVLQTSPRGTAPPRHRNILHET